MSKSETISNVQTTQSPKFDLEERTYRFAKEVRRYVKTLPRTISTLEDAKQLVRSSGSIAANYIEANEALSRKDFLNRIKISRKEAKESVLWLRLLDSGNQSGIQKDLLHEATELMKIFGSIVTKSSC